MPEKCMSCKVYHEILKSDVPACCKWFMDNIVIGDCVIEECTEYEPVEEAK